MTAKQRNWAIGLCCAGMILTVLCAAVHFVGLNGRTYVLNLPEPAGLSGATLSTRGGDTVELDGKGAEEVVLALGDGRTTQEEIIQDAPVNVEDYIQVDFHFAGGGTITLFVYQRKSEWVIEQPYNGIYVLSDAEAQALEQCVGGQLI